MKLPSRLRRLEDALFALPDDCMLLSDVDGYLTGLILCPETVPPAEWLPVIWGGVEAGPPFEDPLDVQDFEAMLVARHAEIARDLSRGKFRPFFEVDPRNGDVLWDVWIEGLATAIDLRPEAWAAVEDPALAYLETLVAIADDTSDLASDEINALYDAAAGEIPAQVAALYARREGQGVAVVEPAAPAAKVGRNDPCPCGSGKKHKKCCGVN
ncbi:UPF0149 family protein [Sphingomonas ginsenosidivorax]|uniref:UPF0149 family protein n=1 Tax=Sphingomonas ginsenosidivorax TaxID=862135 RepID=A0A5C6UDD8_9SPHN|nr:UPF0149 family protein [Sphingomonas ginsenosidivorax]TXC70664.1 UPF0149 family protein [Sphingomonas ginsenosidivorax]